MAVRKILSYPEDRDVLCAQSLPVDFTDPVLIRDLEDIRDTLLATPNGVGLAAPQIGILKRIFMLRLSYIAADLDPQGALAKERTKVLVFINPKIISAKGEICENEGCLSVPEKYIPIRRAKIVKIKAVNERNEPLHERMIGLAARAVQQEIDHLNGVLILDHQHKGG